MAHKRRPREYLQDIYQQRGTEGSHDRRSVGLSFHSRYIYPAFFLSLSFAFSAQYAFTSYLETEFVSPILPDTLPLDKFFSI